MNSITVTEPTLREPRVRISWLTSHGRQQTDWLTRAEAADFWRQLQRFPSAIDTATIEQEVPDAL